MSSSRCRAGSRRAAWLWICASAIATPALAEDDQPVSWLAAPPRPASVAGAAPSRAGSELVIAALNFLDRPYQRGGHGVDSGFDCSGFTRHLFAQSLGIELPRRVDDQAHAGALRRVQRDSLQVGDLVFFNTLRRTFSHVGVYIGDGRFIHAPRTGGQIRIESLSTTYWARRFTGARRALVLEGDRPVATTVGLPR